MTIINTPKDLNDLKTAVDLLERDSLTMKMAAVFGEPIEFMLKKLPKGADEKIQKVVHTALNRSVDVALKTMSDKGGKAAFNKTHMGVATLSGAVGGFFGLPGMLIELPVSTTIMMRSVADIARSHGFDVNDSLVKAECIQVFAMGGPSKDDDAAKSAYYSMRNAMVLVANEVGKGLVEVAARQTPVAVSSFVSLGASTIAPKDVGRMLVRLIEAVASRFGVQVTEKMAAQFVPVVGAIGGAAINSLFTKHFQDMAKGHFTVLRLERDYGTEKVRAEYGRLLNLQPISVS